MSTFVKRRIRAQYGRNPYFTRFCCAIELGISEKDIKERVAILILLDSVVQCYRKKKSL